MNKIEDYLGIANHDIQVANDNKKLISYVASILCEIDNLQQENQQLKIEISAREEEYKKLENALKAKYYCKYANKCDEFEDCSLEEYKDMAERNMVLSNNWDDLKEFLETNWKETQDIWFVKIINKMEELERGVSNDNRRL